MMSVRTRRNLKADIQVVGKRGGSGAKAQNYVLTRPKDGCTIMALTESHLYTMARGKSDMKIGDLVGVARAMEEPNFIIVNAKNKKLSTIKKIIKEAMISVSSSEYHMFSVPLEVSINSGDNWGEAH